MRKKCNLFTLSEKEQKNVIVGSQRVCVCTCAYVNCGGSSANSNYNANYEEGKNGKMSIHLLPQC